MSRIKETKTAFNYRGEKIYENHRFISAAFDEEKGYLLWVRKRGPRGFSDIDLPEQVTYAEAGRLTKLSRRMWGDTNMLGYKGNGTIKPYDIEGIGRIVDLRQRQAYTFVNKMLELGVMAKVKIETKEHKEVQYYLNPLYFFNNTRLSFNLYLIFKEQLNHFLPRWVISKYNEQEREKNANAKEEDS